MFDDLLSMLAERVSETRVALYRDALNRLYVDFKCNGLEDFASDMVAGADSLYDVQELDIIVSNGLIELYKQKLLAFGVRVHPNRLTLDSLRPLHSLCSAIFECEFRDDTDRLLSIVNDEDLSAAEMLAELTQHSYGVSSTTVIPLIAYVQPDLVLQMQQVLSRKHTKESTVEDDIHVPEFIKLRLQAFQGTYGGVFFDYVNSGGAVAVPFEALMAANSEQLAPVRSSPHDFTWELIFFALASTMPNPDVIPTVQQLITINFPMMEDHRIAQAALNEFVSNYGKTLQ